MIFCSYLFSLRFPNFSRNKSSCNAVDVIMMVAMMWWPLGKCVEEWTSQEHIRELQHNKTFFQLLLPNTVHFWGEKIVKLSSPHDIASLFLELVLAPSRRWKLLAEEKSSCLRKGMDANENRKWVGSVWKSILCGEKKRKMLSTYVHV